MMRKIEVSNKKENNFMQDTIMRSSGFLDFEQFQKETLEKLTTIQMVESNTVKKIMLKSLM